MIFIRLAIETETHIYKHTQSPALPSIPRITITSIYSIVYEAHPHQINQLPTSRSTSPTMAYTKIAVAGATGNLGPAIVNALVDAGLSVTILSQSGKTSNLPSSVTVKKVDYASASSVTAALSGIEAFVSLIPKHDEQNPLIDAAIAAGVKRFLPSDFGSDVPGNALTADLPVFAGKKKTTEYLRSVQDKISHTFVLNGLFLDWGLEVGFAVSLKGDRPTRIVNGGSTTFSTTLLSDVGKAVVGVLRNPEQTANRAVKVQSTVTSQNELLEIAHRVKPELKLERVEATTKEVLDQAYADLNEGGDKIMPAMLGFIGVSVLDQSYGSDWSKENDNALLGITELDRSGLERIVKQYV